jgi:uncharacterized protein (DUF1697 family)
MPIYIALLRAVNVGGTGTLPMAELKEMCVAVGFTRVQTYIASGNVVLAAKVSASKVKAVLEQRLRANAGKPIGVLVRTADEIAGVLKANPFPDTPPHRTVAIFLDDAPERDVLSRLKGVNDEEVRLGRREIYVHYPSGQGRSKLKIPGAEGGTARNINTVAKLVEIATAIKAADR